MILNGTVRKEKREMINNKNDTDNDNDKNINYSDNNSYIII